VLGLLALVWAVWDHDALLGWTARARPVPFFAVMAVVPALGVPMTPFFILAGATFGAPIACLGSAIAIVANLTLCYALARGRLRSWTEAVFRRFDYELPDFTKERRGSVRFSLLVKLAPGIPGALKHYALALTGVPFTSYLIVSGLVTGTYAAALILLGQSLFEHELRRALPVIAILVVLALGLWWWQKRRGGRAAPSPGTPSHAGG